MQLSTWPCWGASVVSVGVVLAGGLSSRMGQDKSQLMRNEQCMLDFSRQVLEESGISNVVISGDNVGGIPDLVKQAGPLGGILSVLKAYQPNDIIALPVDMPLITSEAIRTLITRGRLAQKPVHYANHPLPLYLPVTAFVEHYLDSAFKGFTGRGPSFKALLNQTQAIAVSPKSNAVVTNTNTPEEWQLAIKELNIYRSNHVRSRLN